MTGAWINAPPKRRPKAIRESPGIVITSYSIHYTKLYEIVDFLKAQWIERDGARHRLVPAIGGIFGHGNVAGLGQAIEERAGDALPFFQPKNEQGLVHTAIAWTKERNRLGALACTTSIGPGATNLVTAAATAHVNRLPLLLLPGDRNNFV